MDDRKIIKLIFLIFFLIGTITLIVGTAIAVKILNYKDKVEVTGIIDTILPQVEGECVYISYIVDGKEYISKLNGYSSSFYEGKEIKIYYDKNDPNKIGTKTLDSLVFIAPGIGLIFFLIGGIGLLVPIMKGKKYERLRESGTLVYANYVETVYNMVYSVNGSHPYNIICEWNNSDDGKKYLLRSGNLWVDPTRTIEEKQIKEFPVYINLNNKKKYFIDTTIITGDIVDLR
mgnify:FL=1